MFPVNMLFPCCSAFDDEANHGRLDHLFNLLMFQLLYKRDNMDVGLKGDLPHYQDIFLQMLPGIRWLSLPDEIKVWWSFLECISVL